MTRDLLIRRAATGALAACAFIVATTAAYPLVRSRMGPAAPVGYAMGDRIDVPQSVYEGAPETLVIFVRSSCGACQRMKLLLTGLIARLTGSSALGIVAVAGRSDAEAALRYITEIGLDKNQLVTMDLTALRLTLVPTIVVVNKDGEVRYVRAGVPSSPEEEEGLARDVMSFALVR